MAVKKWSLLMLAGVLAATSAACSDDEDIEGPKAEVFVATLLGTEEPPPIGPVTTTATGSARVEFTPTGLLYSVSVANLQNVTLAHIHTGARGVSGGVVLNLNPTLGTVNGVLAASTATTTNSTTIGMDSLKALIRNGNAYVNVHTTANPQGHIRGQLVKQ